MSNTDLFVKVIEELDEKIIEGCYEHFKNKYLGIRSSQIAVLIMYLIEKGIIKE